MIQILYFAAAIVVVFLCLFCYRLGIKDGRALKENRPLEKAINIPAPSKKDDGEMAIENQYANLFGFQPKFTETRGDE